MQYIDSNTDPGRIPDDVEALLSAMLRNQQIRYEGQDETPNVTKAIKYDRQRQKRRKTSPYAGDDPFVESIIEVFGFDPLDFQVESWQLIDKLDTDRQMEGATKAAIFSAPTGFGKTEAFLGPLYRLLREGRQESVAIVYPSRALLQDQLKRILKHVHDIKTTFDDQLSVGCYVGNMPWNREDIGSKSFFDSSSGPPRFTLCNCWCSDEESHAFEYHGTSTSYEIVCEHDPSHSFTERELVIPRYDLVFNNQPDILLTTLQSLEAFAHKPHYPLVDAFDTIVLDEIHLNTGLQGAHAANIIQNVNDISDDPLLWIGSSATIDDPERFGKQIFGLSSANIEKKKPPASDFDQSHDDTEHYYFMLAQEDGPTVSSMAIQQSMLLGHTMLEDDRDRRSKQLSFIDSISQINQQLVQFENADQTNELWQFHRDNRYGEDWGTVSAAMGQGFIDEPLEFMPVYAEKGFDRDTVTSSDILLSTNFLEVGIDVGEIKIITQYRTPWNLSSFLQRAGRAARKPDMDSHIAVYLSSLTSDSNMFYRADRFLASDIRTPLNTDNRVVEWIHDRFNRYYEHVAAINDDRYWSDLEAHTTFLERYLYEDLGYDSYYRLIIEPSAFLEEELDIDIAPDRLLSKQVVEDVRGKLSEHLQSQRGELADIEEFFEMENGEIIRGSDAIETYLLEVQEQTLTVTNIFDGQVAGFVTKLEAHAASGYESLSKELETELSAARERAQDIPDDATEAVAHFSSLLADLFGLTGTLMQLRNRANAESEEPVPQVNQQRLSELNSAVNQLEKLTEDERLQEYYSLEKRIHYLDSALEEYESYLDSNTPYNSLYRIKDLLRGAYYFDLYLQADGRQLDDEVWFVPPDYFGSSGQFVKILREDSTRSRPEEAIDQVMSTFAPYHSQYQSQAGIMQAFLPKTAVTEDGVVMDYTRHVSGEQREGVLVPDTIELTEMEDLSGESANEMVRYCPMCFQVLTGTLDSCLRHDERAYGKIHSEPHIETTVTDRSPDERRGNLTLADLEAKISLGSVSLEITPGRYYGEDIGVTFDSDAERFTQELQSPDRPLGYTTRTRGLVYDLEAFVASLDEDIRSSVERYKDPDDLDLEQLAYHTAAHFFLQLVTDISSVSTQRVYYGFDTAAGEVYVFERAEGGQGIVDLVFDELQTDPGSVLESMNRLMYNEQVLNERLWARSEFVEALPSTETDTDHIRPVVASHLSILFDEVVDRVTEEVISTVDHAKQFADDEGGTVREVYELKHVVSREQIEGTDEFPREIVERHSSDIENIDRIETTFYSPDIDGCVENLHLTECIEAGDQSETLSCVVLEELREHLIETVPTSEAAETMFDYELPPGGELNGKSIFLDF